MLTIPVWQWLQYIVLKWCSETADCIVCHQQLNIHSVAFLCQLRHLWPIKKNWSSVSLRLHFVSVSIAKCWQARVFESLMYYWKVENLQIQKIGFSRIPPRIRLDPTSARNRPWILRSWIRLHLHRIHWIHRIYGQIQISCTPNYRKIFLTSS